MRRWEEGESGVSGQARRARPKRARINRVYTQLHFVSHGGAPLFCVLETVDCATANGPRRVRNYLRKSRGGSCENESSPEPLI